VPRVVSYGHVLREDDSEWVKKCMDFVVEGVREVVKEDMKSLKLVRSKWYTY